jgi:outer membrane protein assembly factor BamB
MSGVARDADPPLEWSEAKNVAWKTRLPGSGNSTPIVWGERIFLLTAVPTDRQAAGPGTDAEKALPDWRRSVYLRPDRLLKWEALALNSRDGSIAWRQTLAEEAPHEGSHSLGSWANASPVTDGERLYACLGSRGLHCLDLEGRKLWEVRLGRMKVKAQFGEGSSPALFGDRLVINWDHEGDDFIVVLDKLTGKEVWRAARDEVTSWGTPVVLPVRGRPQVIVAAANRSRAYDLETGKEVWSCAGMTHNVVPTPVHSDGLLFLASGFRGNALQAVRLEAAQGELAGPPAIVWTRAKDTPYVPSLLLYGDNLYLISQNKNLISCLDAGSGNVHFLNQQLTGLGNIFSSPAGAADRVYVVGENGVAAVVQHGTEFRLLATNKLSDRFVASPVIVGKTLFLRGRENLYCLREASAR